MQRFLERVLSVPFAALPALRAFLSPKRFAGHSLSRPSGVYTPAHLLDIVFLQNEHTS